MNTFITADPHFGHARIIELTHRPFKSVEEMDAMLIHNWNATVPIDATVVVAGDFSFHPERYVDRLNGTIILVRGNHDPDDCERYFSSVHDTLMLGDGKSAPLVWVSHYPHRIWPHMHDGARHIYGHVHGEIIHPIKGSMDIGVDVNGFTPIRYEDVIRLLESPNLDDLQCECRK